MQTISLRILTDMLDKGDLVLTEGTPDYGHVVAVTNPKTQETEIIQIATRSWGS